MELREQFNAQWNGIKDVILSETKRQITFKGRVDAELLTAKLHEEAAKWEQGILVQGVWFKKFTETMPNNAGLFLVKVAALSFIEPVRNKKPCNGWAYCLFVILAVLLGYVLHAITEMSIFEQAFYPILSFVIMRTLYVPVRNRRKASFERRILGDIGCQLDGMCQELEQYVK